MNKEREQHWLSILKISAKMRQLAQELQWNNLAQLENKRQYLIKSFFSRPVPVEDAEVIREGIHQILDMDQQIIFMGKRHRGVIGGKLIEFKKHRKVVSAHKTHSG